MTETIVAAAVIIPTSDDWKGQIWQGNRVYPDYLIVSSPAPARHHTIMHPISDHLKSRIGPDQQGFLTSKGRFVDRVEAMHIVISSNQPRLLSSTLISGNPLFSEDLW